MRLPFAPLAFAFVALAPARALAASPPPPSPVTTRVSVDQQVARQSSRVLRALTPEARAKVIGAARAVNARFAEKQPPGAKPLDPLHVAGAAATQAQLQGADITTLAFIVLMQATQDADEDLKQLMEKMRAINAFKAALRETRSNVHAAAASLKPTPSMPKSAIDAVARELEKRADSLSDMSEMTQLRLQMLMDRLSKFTETLSNLLKKIEATSDGVVQNMK
jgi:hypothetical protein